MKKYRSSGTKILAVIAAVCVCMLIAGMIAGDSFSYTYELTLLGGGFGIIFVPVFIAERSRYLIIDEEKVIFPPGCNQNEKLVFQRLEVRFDEICSVKIDFHKGESEFMAIVWGLFGLTSVGDQYSYTLNLIDDTKIEVGCLYQYGEKAEKEISEMICRSVEKCGGQIY